MHGLVNLSVAFYLKRLGSHGSGAEPSFRRDGDVAYRERGREKCYWFQNTGVMGLYDQEVSLRQQCNELFSLKDKRKQMLTGLVADNRKFCDALGDSHFTISNPEIRYRMATLDALAEVNATLQQTFVSILRESNLSALQYHSL